MEIKGKVALVTGSAKRVGRSIAVALAKRGAHVVIHYRRSENEARSVASQVRGTGVRSMTVQGNLAVPSEARNLVRRTIQTFKRIDILVNSASLYEKTPLKSIHEKEWNAHLDSNLKGPFFTCLEASQSMLKQKRGKIVNVIDSDIHHPYQNYLPYLVSKSGLAGLTACLALELAPHVQVNGVSPGPVVLPEHWGPKIRQAVIQATPLKKIGDPQDIANTVLFCIEGTDFMTGAIIPVDGGQHIAGR